MEKSRMRIFLKSFMPNSIGSFSTQLCLNFCTVQTEKIIQINTEQSQSDSSITASVHQLIL